MTRPSWLADVFLKGGIASLEEIKVHNEVFKLGLAFTVYVGDRFAPTGRSCNQKPSALRCPSFQNPALVRNCFRAKR